MPAGRIVSWATRVLGQCNHPKATSATRPSQTPTRLVPVQPDQLQPQQPHRAPFGTLQKSCHYRSNDGRGKGSSSSSSESRFRNYNIFKLYRYLMAAAPAALFRASEPEERDEEEEIRRERRRSFRERLETTSFAGWHGIHTGSNPLNLSPIPASPSQSPSPPASPSNHRKSSFDREDSLPQQPRDRFAFTGTGRLMLGLGTLGVLAYTKQSDTRAGDDVLRHLDFRAMKLKVGTSPEEHLPIKRKLFQNLQDMFNLGPEAEKENTQDDHKNSNAARSRRNRPDVGGVAGAPKKPEDGRHIFEHLVVGDKLVLSEGDITKDQWKALSAFLVAAPHIKSLRLQGMEISARDADELGKGLNQIRNITFCDNSIGLHEGSLERLVALLMCCGLLESTSIIRNSIGDADIPHLVDLMKHHTSLSRVSLCWNGITDRGASQIASALEALNSSFRDLDLSYNYISPVGKHKLLEANRRRPEHLGPLSLHLRHNERLFDFKREYQDSLASNTDPPWYLRRSFQPLSTRSKKLKV